MKEEIKLLYIRRSQRDYTMSFKLSVVREVESGDISAAGAMRKYGIQGHGTILGWLRKYGNFDRELYVAHMRRDKSPNQELFELKQEVQLLKKQRAFLERELDNRDQKAIMFDAIVEVVKEDYDIDLLKKVTPERCAVISKRGVKA